MSENNNARILRFHLPDKVFHSMNAIIVVFRHDVFS